MSNQEKARKIVDESLHEGLKAEGYDSYVSAAKVEGMANHVVARLVHAGLLKEETS